MIKRGKKKEEREWNGYTVCSRHNSVYSNQMLGISCKVSLSPLELDQCGKVMAKIMIWSNSQYFGHYFFQNKLVRMGLDSFCS